MALATGNQLKAARALAGVNQQEVADTAGVNVNTIRNMEARGAKPITSSAVTVRNVQLALEAQELNFSITPGRAFVSASQASVLRKWRLSRKLL